MLLKLTNNKEQEICNNKNSTKMMHTIFLFKLLLWKIHILNLRSNTKNDKERIDAFSVLYIFSFRINSMTL